MSEHPIIDMEIIRELRDIMGDGYSTLVQAFIRDGHLRLNQLREAVQAGDAEHLRQTAHSFKGSSGNLGARRLASLCQTMESTPPVEARDLLERIEQAFQEAKAALE